MRIDAHQHFWQYDPVDHAWIDDSMQALRRDFLPRHLRPILERRGIDGSVAVQAATTVEETRWLLELAAENSFIKGVVGWVDFLESIASAGITDMQIYHVGDRLFMIRVLPASMSSGWLSAGSGSLDVRRTGQRCPQDRAATNGNPRWRSLFRRQAVADCAA